MESLGSILVPVLFFEHFCYVFCVAWQFALFVRNMLILDIIANSICRMDNQPEPGPRDRPESTLSVFRRARQPCQSFLFFRDFAQCFARGTIIHPLHRQEHLNPEHTSRLGAYREAFDFLQQFVRAYEFKQENVGSEMCCVCRLLTASLQEQFRIHIDLIRSQPDSFQEWSVQELRQNLMGTLQRRLERLALECRERQRRGFISTINLIPACIANDLIV